MLLDRREERTRPKGPLIAASIAVAWCAVVWLSAFVFPAYSSTTQTTGPNGSIVSNSSRTLVEVNGMWILILLAIPLGITLCAALSARTRAAKPVLIGTTILLWLGIFVTGFSVGLLYLPAGIALFAALLIAMSQTPIRGDHPNLG